uniref:NAD-dependent epimerase/dehydratase domain-containing protein n=1 Tax=Oryza meridionalis TaxID=40149 RepID=A0A0E0F143_9ORYZ
MRMRESNEEEKKSVCVMDASGPLGHALVARLLRRGYTVHAATYPHPQHHPELEDEEEEEEYQQHPRLKLFRADPLDYHAIADAVHGCSGLFAIFNTPSSSQSQSLSCFLDEEEGMVEAEVRAAHNILEACAQTDTMERVVFNSSVTAVVWRPQPEEDDDAALQLDENTWSDLTFCRRFKLWHALAKTLSERTAWALAMDRGVDMVAINAGLLTGPGLTAGHPYLKGAPDMYDHGVLVTVDVDFLADAHIAAYECPTAYGRYLCFNNAICRPEDAAKLAQMLISSAAAPRPPAPPSDELKVIPQRIHTKKLNKLMLDFTSGVYGDIN